MLTKTTQDISFARGLDTKTDPWRVSPQNFLQLTNSVFQKGGRLQKRDGFGSIAEAFGATGITTFQDSLVALTDAGALSYNEQLSAFKFINPAIVQCSLSTLPLIRNSYDQIQSDSVISSNGFVCVVYTQSVGGTITYWYAVNDSITGENLISPTQIATSITSPRVFLLSGYFIILYTVTAVNQSLNYIAINTATLSITGPTALPASTAPNGTTNLAFDGVVTGGVLYVVFNGHGGTGIKVIPIIAPSSFGSSFVVDATHAGTVVTITTDGTNLYCTYLSSTTLYMTATTLVGVNVFGPTSLDTGVTVLNVTSVPSTAFSGSVNVYYEVSNAYGYDSAVPTNYINQVTISNAGTIEIGPFPTGLVRSVGLASKAFTFNGNDYFLTAFQSPFQNTYFLYQPFFQVASKFAYENGGGYAIGLPSASFYQGRVSVSYLFKDFIVSQNLNPSSVNLNPTNVDQVGNIYSQTGINQATFTLQTGPFITSELGNTLNLCGGFLWNYDGLQSTENNFFVFPDRDENVDIYGTSNQLTASSSSGSMSTQDYYYQVIYAWTDNQGNKYRSAPSLPIFLSKNDLTGSTNSVTINVPTLRLSFKTNVTIEIFRWATDQQSYYAIQNFAAHPFVNDTTVDSVSILDTSTSAEIIGNELIYTTGGVVEDASGPACSACTIFDTRLWLIDSEDPNLLWYSKQVIENTPVEMSDLFTFYISPSISAQGSTGPLTCISPMDDKLIVFKKDAIYYINGTGPDITGANSQYSQPIFITSTVGSILQNSIVLTPMGLMFQSDKGIWLLGRGLNAEYIGAPVEDFTTSQQVVSALCIPGTNQVRFVLSNNIVLMYDYFYQQWGTFQGITSNYFVFGIPSSFNASFGAVYSNNGQTFTVISAVGSDLNCSGTGAPSSSGTLTKVSGTGDASITFGAVVNSSLLSATLFNGEQTLLDSVGNIYQETPGIYVDGLTAPVVMSFQTSWFNLTGLQGYQRAYFFYLLGQYLSPHQIQVSMAYDYDSTITQTSLITPSTNPVENWRVFLAKQRCQAFQINFQEINTGTPGPGLYLSGLNLVYAQKKGFRPIGNANTVGGGVNTG